MGLPIVHEHYFILTNLFIDYTVFKQWHYIIIMAKVMRTWIWMWVGEQKHEYTKLWPNALDSKSQQHYLTSTGEKTFAWLTATVFIVCELLTGAVFIWVWRCWSFHLIERDVYCLCILFIGANIIVHWDIFIVTKMCGCHQITSQNVNNYWDKLCYSNFFGVTQTMKIKFSESCIHKNFTH